MLEKSGFVLSEISTDKRKRQMKSTHCAEAAHSHRNERSGI